MICNEKCKEEKREEEKMIGEYTRVKVSVRVGCLLYYDYFCNIIIHNITNDLHFLFFYFSSSFSIN